MEDEGLKRNDALLREATLKAGGCFKEREGDPLEAYLEQALIQGIAETDESVSAISTGSKLIRVPYWDPPMGGYDLRITLDADGEATLVVETKIYNVDETLWDLFKVVAAQSEEAIQGGYLSVAATVLKWRSDHDCVKLFDPSQVTAVWDSVRLFERWSAAWENLLEGGSARPLRIPSQVETRFLAAAAVRGYRNYEVRTIGVRAAEGSHWVEFEGYWPAPLADWARDRQRTK